MILSRTPFRVSFFGGGTDFPGWRREHGGQVLSTASDKHRHATPRYLPPFFEPRPRLAHSKTEARQTVDEIKRPAIREAMRFLGFDRSIEVHRDGDLPARPGRRTA